VQGRVSKLAQQAVSGNYRNQDVVVGLHVKAAYLSFLPFFFYIYSISSKDSTATLKELS